MKILLINASKDHNYSVLNHFLAKLNSTPNLVLQQLAAATPDKYKIKLLDDSIDPPDYNADVDIVGISSLTAAAPRAYELADEFRKHGKTVVLGGFHPAGMPDEAKKHADSVVVGEAENSWPELLKDYEKGRLKEFYKAKSPINPSDIPEPKREIIKYKTLFYPVVTSRGCPFNCAFCTITHFYGKVYRPRPIENIIKEIKNIPRKFLIFIHDASLTIDSDYAKALFKALKPYKKKFYTWGSIPVVYKDEELIKLSSEAGCVAWCFGFESICQESIRKDANKGYLVETYRDLVNKIHINGMNVYGSFVFGFDHDTPYIFDDTLETVYDYGIDGGEFDVLTPFPITRLFKKFQKEGRILTYDWSKYDLHHVVFQPKNMTPEELFNGVKRISREFYSPSNTIKRMARVTCQMKKLSNIVAVGAMNLTMTRFHNEYRYLKNVYSKEKKPVEK